MPRRIATAPPIRARARPEAASGGARDAPGFRCATWLGFAGLAVAWLFTGACAYRAIRTHQVASHRRWMTRNFALTFAAVMLRLYLPAAMVSGLAFEMAYPVIAWLCWVPNLVVAELLFNRRHV